MCESLGVTRGVVRLGIGRYIITPGDLRACSYEPGTVNYPGEMIAPGQELPRVHMMVCCPGATLPKVNSIHCPGASSLSSDHYEII